MLFVFCLASNDAEGSKQLKYKCNTTKTLEMSRVFLVEKEKEKEKEQVRKKLIHTVTCSSYNSTAGD